MAPRGCGQPTLSRREQAPRAAGLGLIGRQPITRRWAIELRYATFDVMADALKTFFSESLVRRLAADIRRVYPKFRAPSFIAQASAGLEPLALLDRGKHIARVLAAHLPKDYPAAVEVLLNSLGPKHQSDELLGVGMAPFYYFPHLVIVEEHGLDHFDLSLRAQYELTQRFSAEACIRVYIAKDPERTFATLEQWSRDPSAHVRRLVSEGTRLRLPWARRVAWLDKHPERVVALLELLKDDPASVVRRSVANSLNDLGKVHTQLATEVCARWYQDASPQRQQLVKHALRSLIKRGNPAALAILGVGKAPRVTVANPKFEPKRVKLGNKLQFSFTLCSKAKSTQSLVVDYAVHFVKASGGTAPKVFKLRQLELPPKAEVELAGRVSFADMTTRRHYPGQHRIDVLVNGVAFPLATFGVK